MGNYRYIAILFTLFYMVSAPQDALANEANDYKTIQKRMASGEFSSLSEAELRQELRGVSPLALLNAAQATLIENPEYTVTLHKRERLRGELQKEWDVLDVKYRRAPLSIFIQYKDGAAKGREALLNEAERPGEITVAEAGVLGLFSFHIDATSPLVKRSSNHSIYEMGLEYPIELMKGEINTLEAHGKSVDLTEGQLVEIDGQRYWEIIVQSEGPPNYYAHWAKLRFDIDTSIIRQMEIRDQDGGLIEEFRFSNLHFTQHPADAFDEDNPAYRF